MTFGQVPRLFVALLVLSSCQGQSVDADDDVSNVGIVVDDSDETTTYANFFEENRGIKSGKPQQSIRIQPTGLFKCINEL